MDHPIFGFNDQAGLGYYGPSQQDVGGRTDARHTEDRLKHLERRLDRMSLACHSMWELIRDNTDFTEEDLVKKILEVDLRDGKADGTIAPEVLVCSNCERNTNSHRSNCLYCGTSITKSSHFT